MNINDLISRQCASLLSIKAADFPKEYTRADKEKAWSECRSCVFMRMVPGNAHIACDNPDEQMTGHQHGRSNGWFYYPILFDPIWKTKQCNNFQEKEGIKDGS